MDIDINVKLLLVLFILLNVCIFVFVALNKLNQKLESVSNYVGYVPPNNKNRDEVDDEDSDEDEDDDKGHYEDDDDDEDEEEPKSNKVAFVEEIPDPPKESLGKGCKYVLEYDGKKIACSKQVVQNSDFCVNHKK